MGQRPRTRLQQLAQKLLAIRHKLNLSQPQLAERLAIDARRISEFESGRREANLLLLLAYARIAGISTDGLIDDDVEVNALAFRLEP